MKTIILLAAIIVGGASCALGKIGETMAECEARYGKPREGNERKKIFQIGGFDVCCWFAEGKCDKISYVLYNESGTYPSLHDGISEAQAMRLLKINFPGQWIDADIDGQQAHYEGKWKSGDLNLNALVHSEGVTVETVERTTKGLEVLLPMAVDAAISEMEKAGAKGE